MLGGRANAHLNIMAPGNHSLGSVTPLTLATHHDNWVSRRALLGPYATLTAPNLPQTLPPPKQNTQALLNCVAAMTTKEDHREVEKMKNDVARSTSVAMVGCVGLENWQNCVTDNAQTDGELHRVLGPKKTRKKRLSVSPSC